MRKLLDVTNAADRAAVSQTNFEKVDAALFQIRPSAGVGSSVIGPPTEGDYLVYDVWIDSKLAEFRCTLAGSPGTWVQTKPAVVPATFAGAPDKYLVVSSADNWQQFYYDLGTDTWKPVFLAPA